MALAVRCLLLCLVGCDQRTPALTENQMAIVEREAPGMTPECLDRIRYGGLASMTDGDPTHVDQCYRMQPSRRWRGLWRDEFEGQQFCPEPATQCSFASYRPLIWLSFRADPHLPGTPPTGRTYLIDFVGRQTAYAGHHGHMGMSDHEVIVDRLISATLVP